MRHSTWPSLEVTDRDMQIDGNSVMYIGWKVFSCSTTYRSIRLTTYYLHSTIYQLLEGNLFRLCGAIANPLFSVNKKKLHM